MSDNPTEALALVTALCRGVRHVLLIERADGAGWAIPGGAVELGVDLGSPLFAVKRQLAEETGLRLPKKSFELDAARDGVVVARCDLGYVDTLPEVWVGGDARRVEWMTLAVMRDVFLVRIFPAHREIMEAL